MTQEESKISKHFFVPFFASNYYKALSHWSVKVRRRRIQVSVFVLESRVPVRINQAVPQAVQQRLPSRTPMAQRAERGSRNK